MGALDIAIVVGYFAVVMGIGAASARRARTSADYLVAGRRLGYGVTFACLCALLLGGASTVGTVALGYSFGISGMWLAGMLGLGLVLVGMVFMRRIYQSKAITISHLLSKRFGDAAGLLSALVSAAYTMMVCATQIIAMGTILQGLIGWDARASMLVIGGIVVLYTILGGMWAITLTDLVQFVLIVAGIAFVLLPLSLERAGGAHALLESLPASYFDPIGIGWPTLVQYFLLYCLGAMVGQDIWQRFLTARSVKVARRSGMAAGVFAILYALTCAIVGMCAQLILPGIDDSQLVFITLAQRIVPPGLLGLVLVAVLAVLMSTASGTLLASSSLLSRDIIGFMLKARDGLRAGQKAALRGGGAVAPTEAHSKGGGDQRREADSKELRTSRLASAAVGSVAILIAVALNDVLAALDVSYALLSGSLFFPIVAGLFCKKVSAHAVIVSIAFSSTVVVAGLAVFGTTAWLPIVAGLLASLSAMVSLTLVENRRGPNW